MKKSLIIIVLIASALSLTSCGSSGWSCQKRYVYVDINKEYIEKHRSGLDSYDKIVLAKVNVKN